MYKVKVDEKLLCFTGSVNGMEYVTDPDVKLVVNGVDSFSFAIYPQHPLYKEIECKVSRVKIWRDSELLFYGEVTGYSQDMYGIRTYDCEGALAWLNDLHFAYAISGATPKEVLYWYIKLYNQKLRDKSKSFELGTVTVHKALTQSGTEGTIARSSGVYPSFWEEIQDKLLDSFGGILRVRYVGSDTCAGYIDWLAIPDGTCSQDVRYAKNLLNCDWTYDCTALATAVVPLGKRKDSSGDNEVRLTIDKADDDDATFMIQYMTGTDDLVKSGNMVYSKSRMEKYGLIQQAVTFDDITDAGTLAYQGAVWLRQNGKAASTIRAEAIDLADIDESVEHFTHGDYVRTKLPGDSAESLFPITAIEIPIAAPENAKLTVGTQESGITSGSGGHGGGSIADAGSGADALAHTHSNKGVLDKITEQDYADFKGAVNKAHIHANKDTLDKIDETSWLLVYGQTHVHENQSVLDKATASYTAAEKTKLAGIAAGAEVNQNAFSTIATGSARYAATAKQSAFLIDGDGGTSVSLDTKTGRLTVSSHTHDNKAVLDQITQTEWTAINSAKNKAHTHDNKKTLDKIDNVSWLTVYGQTHEHSNKAVLDKLTVQDYSDFKGTVNKAHVHDNKGTLDKITDVGWNTVYGNTHSHDNKSVLDKTTAAYTAADKKKLDGMDLSKYLPKDGTAKKAELLSSGQMRSAYGHNDDATFSNGYVWFKIGTAIASGGYDTVTTTFLGICGYGKHALYTARIRLTSAGNAVDSISFLESGRTGGMLTGLFRIVAINGEKGVTFELWAKAASRWEGTRVVILNEMRLEGHDQSNFWTLTSRGNADAKTAPTKGNMHVDSRDSSICATATNASNATTWNGLINDVDTYNSSDTWILVKKDNRIQHRYAGELDVNSAKTLTDSGWVTCPLAVTGNTTYPSSSSSIKVRKYGKLVRLEAMVKYTTVFGTGHNVATIPEGYRPSVLQREHGIISTETEKIFFDATLGVGGSLSFAPAGSGSSTFNPANSYECRMTYFID